jgi:ParB family chromosome partitioning protein
MKPSTFKECKYVTEAIITEGSDVGTVHKVCVNPNCPRTIPSDWTSHLPRQ